MNAFLIAKTIISLLFFICYFYQIIYIFVPFLPRKPVIKPAIKCGTVENPVRVAVLIAARNEEVVIGNLLRSIASQTYHGPVKAFVVADNCTDKTAELAEDAGAVVYKRFNKTEVGKGYALNFLLKQIERDYPGSFDAYLVLDADNLLKEDYVEKMVQTLSQGYEILTSYRNSKNYGDNWISSGYALWFLRESEYLNRPRALLGTSAAVSGTGFMFTRRILEKCNGWQFFLLTEDIQFTVHNILSGIKIGYCEEAILYDEQPVKFRQSWQQRQRWTKGYLQVFRDYGMALLHGTVHERSFSCFDMCMNIMPAMVLSVVSILLCLAELAVRVVLGENLTPLVTGVLTSAFEMYLFLFMLGAITTVTEWKKIHADTFKKLKGAVTFPIFMFTYIPISISALFKHVEWTPIEHSVGLSITDLDSKDDRNGPPLEVSDLRMR